MMFILDPPFSGLHFLIHTRTTNIVFSRSFAYVLDYTNMNDFFLSWSYWPMNSPISSSFDDKFDDKFVTTFPTLFQFQIIIYKATKIPY